MPFTWHLTCQGSYMPHEFWNKIRKIINQANKKSSKTWARRKILKSLHRSADVKMLILDEEKLNTLTILIKKIDLIHRIRSHLEASSISEHLYNPDLSSILALLSKLCKLNKRISPLRNRGRKENLCTLFLSILFVELLLLSLSSFWVHEQAQEQVEENPTDFFKPWGFWYRVLLCQPCQGSCSCCLTLSCDLARYSKLHPFSLPASGKQNI